MRTLTGLTLIEVVVVLGISAILTGILFPVILQARQTAPRTVCLSNLHQLGIAIGLYQNDYDGYYPYGLDAISKDGIPLVAQFEQPYLSMASTMPLLNSILDPYVHSPDVFRCPRHNDADYTEQAQAVFDQYGQVYKYNPYPAMQHCTEDCFADPANSFLMADYFGHQGDTSSDCWLNELFIDRHVKNVRWTDYLASKRLPE